jgi:3-dehydroquinate synthetase
VACALGVRLGRTPPGLADRAERLLEAVGLARPRPGARPRAGLDRHGRDKKAVRDGVRFVLLDDLAAPIVVTPSRDDIDAVLDEVAS